MKHVRLSEMPLWMSVSSVAAVVTVLLVAMLPFTEVMDLGEFREAVTWAAALSAAFVIIWSFFVLPFLWSATPASTDGVPMWRKRLYIAVLLWLPAALITILPGSQFISPFLDWLRGARLDTREWPGLWWPPSVITFVGYAWVGSRIVQHRLRIAAIEAQVCFACGYSLAEIPNCTRCPECGLAVESPVPSTQPGDTAGATARD